MNSDHSVTLDQAARLGETEDAYLREYLKAYIGPNADKYQKAVDSVLAEPQQKLDTRRIGWIWGAFLAPLSWLMYRKLWVFAASIFAINLFDMFVLTEIHPDFQGFGVAISTMVAIIGKAHYVARAKKKIGTIASAAPSHEVALEEIHRIGGVSRLGAWIGAIPNILVVLLLIIVIVSRV